MHSNYTILNWFDSALWHINSFGLFNAKFCSIYIYIYIYDLLDSVLWHSYHCRLFNAIPCLYIYTKSLSYFFAYS